MQPMKRFFLPFAAATIMFSCQNVSPERREMAAIADTAKNSHRPLLYIGTYTQREAHVDGKASGIYVYALDRSTGQLHYVSASPAVINPSYLVVQHDSLLYAVNEIGTEKGEPSGTVSAFRINKEGKELAFINTTSSKGNYPCYIGFDRRGKFAMVANYGSGTVAVISVRPDGGAGEFCSVDRHHGENPGNRKGTAHAHMIIPSPDNRFVYSCDLGTDNIFIYHFDAETGKLQAAAMHYTTQPGAGPRHMVFHPDKNLAYVVNELNGTIECLKHDPVTGSLTRFQVISTVSSGSGNQAACADIHITPSGKYLYASNRGDFNNIAMYAVNSLTGELSLLGHQAVKGKTPRSFVIDPTGTYLLVANQDSGNVVTFRIDPSTGNLLDTGLEASIPTPVCLKFSE
jgi:6-phosphogluconolactonase